VGFLLLDPALVAPTEGTTAHGLDFWERVIGWNADKRAYLGPVTQDLVYGIFGELGWPDYEPPGCPRPLAASARRSLTGLLSRVKQPSDPRPGPTPSISPAHRGGTLVEESIAEDATNLARGDGLTGLASHPDNWETTADPDSVCFDPPPPESLPMAMTPGEALPAERDERVTTYLKTRRVTLIGGRGTGTVETVLEQSFRLAASRLRWIPGERNTLLNLAPLAGVRADRDVVIVITNFVGHPERLKVAARCNARGVVMHLVTDQGEVYDYLRDTFGD
jgi:hypothetical protein